MLGYIRGERYSLAVDAGNSRRHVEKFYAALDAAELRRPDFTVLTHWHWDHTFGLHAVDGAAIACEATNEMLCRASRWKWSEEKPCGNACGRVKKLNSVTSISVPNIPTGKKSASYRPALCFMDACPLIWAVYTVCCCKPKRPMKEIAFWCMCRNRGFYLPGMRTAGIFTDLTAVMIKHG